MLVYRVEDRRGDGPYRGENAMSDMGLRHTDPEHPTPSNEGIPDHDRLWMYCGFSSLEQFKDWFSPSDRYELSDKGFRLVSFDADHVGHGIKQIMFDRSEAWMLDAFDPVNLTPIAVFEG